MEEKTLWSLLMPWESGMSSLGFIAGRLMWLVSGRCSLEANSRPIDVRNVVWLGTSNVGHDVVAEHHAKRDNPDLLMSREEYLQLMNLVREPVSKHMGVRYFPPSASYWLGLIKIGSFLFL